MWNCDLTVTRTCLQIGLYVLLAWMAADLCAGWRHRRVALGGCAMIILVALILCARAKLLLADSESLWTHSLACAPDNATAHNNIGVALFQKGKADEAIVHYRKALQINPDDVEAHINLGNTLLQKGDVEEAMTYYQKALQLTQLRRSLRQPRQRSAPERECRGGDCQLSKGFANLSRQRRSPL